jgi:hypothetical protein
MVPSLSAQNLQCIEIGEDFMFGHSYIEHDFDVDEWARPEFLDNKLPAGGALEAEAIRLG